MWDIITVPPLDNRPCVDSQGLRRRAGSVDGHNYRARQGAYTGTRWSDALRRGEGRCQGDGGGKGEYKGNGEYGRCERAHGDTLLCYATMNGVGAKGAEPGGERHAGSQRGAGREG